AFDRAAAPPSCRWCPERLMMVACYEPEARNSSVVLGVGTCWLRSASVATMCPQIAHTFVRSCAALLFGSALLLALPLVVTRVCVLLVVSVSGRLRAEGRRIRLRGACCLTRVHED